MLEQKTWNWETKYEKEFNNPFKKQAKIIPIEMRCIVYSRISNDFKWP